MASINPNLPQIPQVTGKPLSHLSPLKAGKPPEESVPTETVNLQPPQQQDPVEPTRSGVWLKRAAMGGLGLGLLATGAIVGGAFNPALSAAPNKTQNVQVKKTQKAAPKSMLQEQTAPIHLKTARFGVEPTVRTYGESGVRHEIDRRVEAKEGQDGELTHDIRIDRIHGADGHVLYSSDDAELGTLDFHDQAEMNWRTRSELKPAGAYGKYVSVVENTTRFSGGASDAHETKLRTIDLTTRNVVNLSELLNGEDYVKIAQEVEKGLNSVQGAAYHQPDMESLDHHMNNGFALNQEKDGSITLTIAIPSNSESDGSKVAEFVFQIPARALQQ